MKFMSKTLPVVVSAAVALTSVPAFAAQSDTGIEINGQSVTFTDVTPYEADGTLYLPYAAMMETEGYQAVQTEEGIVATKGDEKIVFQIGGSTVEITKDGQTYSIPMAPSVLTDDRTFVTVTSAEDIFGMAGTVENGKVSFETPTYEIMDKLNAFSAEYNTNMKAEGTLNVDVNYPDVLDLSTKSDITSVTTDTITAFEMLTKSEYGGDDEATKELLKQLENIKYIVDLDTNKLYFFFGATDGEAAWYVMDLGEVCDMLGMDVDALKGLMDPGSMDFSSYMQKFITSMFHSDPEAAYAVEKTMRDFYCDQRFHQSSKGYQADYSVDEDGVSVDMSISIQTDGQDHATGYSMAMTSEMDGQVLFSMNITLNQDMNMKLSGSFLGASIMADIQYSKLESTPEIKLPENAQPFSFSDLVE